MKKTLLAGFLSVAAFSSMAADNVDLKVTGVLVNGACTPTLDGGGVVNYGNIPLGNLSATATNQLGSKNINLTITCDQAMPVGFTATDNRNATMQTLTINNAFSNGANSSATGNQFGLGATAGGVKIGAYAVGVNLGSVTADGAAVDTINNDLGADTNGRNWLKTATGAWANGSPNTVRVFTSAATGTLVPLAAKVFVYPLKVTAAIQSTNTLAITSNTNLDGDATISLVYL
jgi:hypothetical protein